MTTTTDSVAAFCDATRTNDLDALVATLAPDAELISPLSGRMVFRGHDDLRLLLGAVYGDLRDLTWDEAIGDGPTRVAISEGRVGGVTITDALVFELDGSGRIRRLRPHLRPWLATTVFAMRLGPKLVRNPGVLRRALRR
ncbi:nuclear transport factor 2 family protein [Mycolicibacterium septicum]|uniref:nuclear transport factor 2 family protein n=1 Tax=Mycolicibacterium septicum TaxID=98668 RepID=UPI001AFA33A5|nr:nuclear transport factor 2 family protein [Mycolicibacterium septicum]QRY54166.1 nuclear transport factor 2 family protein [Mycolicibacterium septicum]